MDKKRNRDCFNAAMVQKTAEIANVETDFVYKVLRGDRNNEGVMSVYMELHEGTNLLVQAVKGLDLFGDKGGNQDKNLVVCYQ